MRQAFLSVLFLFITIWVSIAPVQAQSRAADLFNSLGGTTTMDKGGAVHSQARSIYSMGGGMTSFQGKRVSLLAADPPSFSAGCSGISWHFGGFSFISMDEIRQLVESVAQASLGVVVDLAMQTLCPQCYAVMSKLRDISNMMRNAAADSCKIAQHMGALLKGKLGPTGDQIKAECGKIQTAKNESTGFLNSVASSACGGLESAQAYVKGKGTELMNWFNKQMPADGKSISDERLQGVGNHTYEMLSKLGYQDGFIKDILLSYMGMQITFPVPSADCREAFANLYGSSVASTLTATLSAQQRSDMLGTAQQRAELEAREALANGEMPKGMDTSAAHQVAITPADTANQPKMTDAAVADNAPDAPDAKTTIQTCYAPPLLTGLDALGKRLICGFAPLADLQRFEAKFGPQSPYRRKIDDTGLGLLCQVKSTRESLLLASGDEADPMLYQCKAYGSGRCSQPKMVRYSDAVNSAASANPDGTAPEYTGLAWMVLDALYSGVAAVANNTPLPDSTKQILNGSGYPLYRVLNLAAVYPGMADELLQAYGGIIAVHYAMDTMGKLITPGTLPAVDSQGNRGGFSASEFSQMRSDIMNLARESGKFAEQMQARMSEKRALVATIQQVNRAVQAEVISQGLTGNANLALSVKKQMSANASANQGPQQP